MNLDEYKEIKRKIEQAQRTQDKAQGALEQQQLRLKKEFDCKNLEQAEILLSNLRQELSQKEEELEEACSRWKSKWENKL